MRSTLGAYFLFCFAVCASAQGTISTVAGSAWDFFAASKSSLAVDAPLGPIGRIAFDSAGNLYAPDFSNHLVVKISPAGLLQVVAGTGVAGHSGDGGLATAAQLMAPLGVAVDGNGNLFIAEDSNYVRKVDKNGIITSFAGNGNAGYSGDGGPAVAASLYNPTDVSVDAAGNLYIADSSNYRVRKVSPGGTISTFAGGVQGPVGDGGPALKAKVVPIALAFDAIGNLFIADYNNRIRKVALDGTITTVAGNGTGGYSGDGGVATSASLSQPNAISFDTAGNLFISDSRNGRIAKVDLAGTISTFAGGSRPVDGSDDSDSAFRPAGVAVDAGGNVYIAIVNRILKVSPSGAPTTFAGTGRYRFTGDGGPATAATLYQPSGVAFDASGNLYIADAANSRIRKVDTQGVISTVAGGGKALPGIQGSPATSVALSYPYSIGLDSFGDLFIADRGTFLVWRVATDGTLTPGFPASSYTALGTPGGVAGDSAGNLFFCDVFNNVVLRATPSGLVTVYAGAPATAGLSRPYALAINAAGDLFIADTAGVVKVDTQGVLTKVMGGGSSSADGVAATKAYGNAIQTIAVDVAENLFLLMGSHPSVIRRVATNGLIYTVAGGGAETSDGGLSTNADLGEASGLAVSGGSVYFSDGISRVRKFPVQSDVSVGGTVSASAAADPPGGVARIPLNLALDSHFAATSLKLTLTITPVGNAAAFTAALAFSNDPAHAFPAISGVTATSITLTYSNLTTFFTGKVHLGDVVATVPGGAATGQAYTIHLSEVSAPVSAGADSLLRVGILYMVGDVFPSTADNAGNFGDGNINTVDLLATLRAITGIPGSVPANCSDRFDAMDAYPSDLGNVRGGDGVLNILDLLAILRRVTGIDSTRPTRTVSTCSSAQPVATMAEGSNPEGIMEYRREGKRTAIYLRAKSDLSLLGLSFAIGGKGKLSFTPNLNPPSLTDNEALGTLALAWLDGFDLKAGNRILLGCVNSTSPTHFFGISANDRSGRVVPINALSPASR